MMYRSKFQYVPLMVLGMLLFIGTATASAGPIEDIPGALGDSLGITDTAAEMVLSACVLMSVGLILAVMKGSNMAMTVIILLAFVGMLTAIGWLEPWLLIMAALIIALMFGAQLRDWGESTSKKG